MPAESTFTSGPYSLRCSGQPLANGSYVPALVITKNEWMARARTIAVEKGSFATAEDAIAAAHQAGLQWIRNYG